MALTAETQKRLSARATGLSYYVETHSVPLLPTLYSIYGVLSRALNTYHKLSNGKYHLFRLRDALAILRLRLRFLCAFLERLALNIG